MGRFGYGLGYMIELLPETSVMLGGHRGANTGWHAIFNVNPITNDGFIMMTNGGAGQDVYHPIFFDWVLWQIGVPLEDWYNAKPSISKKMKSIIDSTGIDNIAAIYTELKENQPRKYDFSESQLNELGHYYISKESLEKARAIFELNIEIFPNSFNVYDSYGEALLMQGEKEEAIENYKQSVRLNPDNEHGIMVLNDLGVSKDDIAMKIPVEQLQLLAGEYVAATDAAWKMIFEVVDGNLVGNDAGATFNIIPLGDNEFVYRNDGARLVFDTKNQDAIRLLLFDKYEFTKVK